MSIIEKWRHTMAVRTYVFGTISGLCQGVDCDYEAHFEFV